MAEASVYGGGRITVRVTSDPIALGDCSEIATESDGALVVFCGVVRSETDGRAVTGLKYEAYREMAERQMRQIAARAQNEHGATSVWLLHRTGDLSVGDVSVITAVSAPHRDAAFGACRFCIDEVKQRAAIWKKEVFADGGSRWVEGA